MQKIEIAISALIGAKKMSEDFVASAGQFIDPLVLLLETEKSKIMTESEFDGLTEDEVKERVELKRHKDIESLQEEAAERFKRRKVKESSDDKTTNVVSESTVVSEVETEVKPAEPVVETEVKPAEPEVETEVKPAEPVVETEVKPAEPEVATEVKPAEPVIETEVKPAEPVVTEVKTKKRTTKKVKETI